MTNATTALQALRQLIAVVDSDGPSHAEAIRMANGGDAYWAAIRDARAALAAPAPALDAPAVLPSEAVIGFAAWLTCREESVTFGSGKDASPAAELTGQYWQAQGWETPREDFASRLKRLPDTARASQPTPAQDAAATVPEVLEAVCKAADAGAGGWVSTARIREALSTTAPHAVAHAGWMLVPVEPTPEMLAASWAQPLDSHFIFTDHEVHIAAAWAAMLAAAPTPSAHPVAGQGQACQTCGGVGMVGGLTRDGYDGMDCPDCAAPTAPQAPALVPLTEHHKLDNDQQVFFYEQDFYVLSNFSSFALRWKGLDFPTSEHAYHWEKYNMRGEQQAECRNRIHGARSAHDAFKVASELKPFRRADWDDVKVGIMRDILREKVRQHEYVRHKLLATGDRELIEDSWRDDYWGWGPNRDGQNMLGKLWMEVRADLRGITPAGTTPKEQQ